MFITGSSSGIRKETAKFFAKNGRDVVATMRDMKKEKDPNQIKNIHLYNLDVTQPKEVVSVVAKVIKEHQIDVVFSNAGYALSGPLDQCSEEQIDKQIKTLQYGSIYLIREFIPYSKKQKKGLFIITTSISGIIGFPLNSIYSASKAALEVSYESLSYELLPFNIYLKTIVQGIIDSDFNSRLDSPKFDEKIYKEIAEKSAAFTSEGKLNTKPSDVAKIVFDAATFNKNKIRHLVGDDACKIAAKREKLGVEGFRKYLTQKIFS